MSVSQMVGNVLLLEKSWGSRFREVAITLTSQLQTYYLVF